jgi:hypothetical protein
MFKDSPEGQTFYCMQCEEYARKLEGRNKIIASQRKKLNKVKEWAETLEPVSKHDKEDVLVSLGINKAKEDVQKILGILIQKK